MTFFPLPSLPVPVVVVVLSVSVVEIGVPPTVSAGGVEAGVLAAKGGDVAR